MITAFGFFCVFFSTFASIFDIVSFSFTQTNELKKKKSLHKFLKFAPEQNVLKASLALLELDWMACGVTVQSITVTLNLLSLGLHG